MPRYEDTRINIIAKEVAKCFGGKHLMLGDNSEYFESWAQVDVPAFDMTLGYRLILSMKGYGSQKHQMNVGICPLEREHQISVSFRFPDINLNSERDIQSICADISRRLVNNEEVVTKLHEYEKRLGEFQRNEQSLKEKVEELLRDCPNVHLSENFPLSSYEARLFSKGVGTYFNARMAPDGEVTFDRIGSVSEEKAKRIFTILWEKE